ncbi:MAG: hypothetical protein HRU20_24895 [Pseudomonadales bacterium]|nr:hypothetical protein [Pseudomonadales bacterium]
MYPNLLNFNHYRYLKIGLILLLICVLGYGLQGDIEPASGASFIGLALGIFSALLIIVLLLLGIRKRSFQYQLGRYNGWLSCHVYLGCVLLVSATLHTGFQWGWNIHGLAYGLMCLVIFSGVFGVFAYIQFPQYLTEEYMHRDKLMRLQDIDEECVTLSSRWQEIAHDQDFSRTLHLNIYSAICLSHLGGSAWQQLLGRDSSTRLLFEEVDVHLPEENAQQHSIIHYLSQHLSKLQAQKEDEHNRHTITVLQQLLVLFSEKKQLLGDLSTVIRYKALLQLWLYFHIPLSIALLVAVSLHILSVFLYW